MVRDLSKPVPAEVYQRVFQEDADGSQILDELAQLFYDVPCYVRGGSEGDAIYIDGGRRVIKFIMQRAGTTVQGGQ